MINQNQTQPKSLFINHNQSHTCEIAKFRITNLID